jgi:Mce-associated membrane protein
MTSRNPIGRPRKIAGQQAPSVVEQRAPASVVETPEAEETAGGAEAAGSSGAAPAAAGDPTGSRTGGRRTPIVLVAMIAVLALVGIGEIVYLARDHTPTVSSSRPVVTGDITQRTAVETAARSTEDILSTTYTDYDHQIDEATTKMTDAFAAQYRETSDGIKDKFIANRTKLQYKVVAQGVVRASSSQAQVLLFLNQYVERRIDGKPDTDVGQYRALVTVVHTDQGWLVSNIETQ